MKVAGQPYRKIRAILPAHLSVFLAGLFFIAAVTNTNRAEAGNVWQQLSAAYLTDTGLNKITKGGMPYKLWPSKLGKKAEPGKFAKIHLKQWLGDSVVMDTWPVVPFYIAVTPSYSTYDVSEVLPTLKEGDSILSIQMMDTFLKRDPSLKMRLNFKEGDKFITSLVVLKVFDSQQDSDADETHEADKRTKVDILYISEYLKKNSIPAIQTANGNFIEIVQPGTGAKVDSGKYVTVKYTGRLFSGQAFDSNIDSSFGHTEPLGFTVGRQEMLPGFDEAVKTLKVGAKARFFIPSMQAYGKSGRPPKIQRYENLIFEVEVLSVSANPSN